MLPRNSLISLGVALAVTATAPTLATAQAPKTQTPASKTKSKTTTSKTTTSKTTAKTKVGDAAASKDDPAAKDDPQAAFRAIMNEPANKIRMLRQMVGAPGGGMGMGG